MPSSHGSSMLFTSFRRPMLTVRDNLQVHSETSDNSDIQNLNLFQKQVHLRFHNLAAVDNNELLSFSWIHKLLDTFTSCQADFQLILRENKSMLSKPPADKLATEYFDKCIKAMDIFNATRDGIETLRMWQKHLDIIVTALDIEKKVPGEGQFRRARKSLMDLALVMLHEKDTGSIFSHRNRSFARKGNKDHQRNSSGHSSGHSRSLSWSVSPSWSASKQLQSIGNNLIPPRVNDLLGSNGLAMLVFTMSFILMFVLWALVAAIPCQDRSVQISFTVPRNFPWSVPVVLLQNRIMEESKKRDRRNSSGLLMEIYQIEKCVNQITDLIDAAQFPLAEEVKDEVRENVQELSSVCEVCKTELDPLERQLREVFRKVMSCRIEGIEFLGKGTET